jgi:elongation factor G
MLLTTPRITDDQRSTQGRASYSMQFARYEEAPRMIADEIIGRAQGK